MKFVCNICDKTVDILYTVRVYRIIFDSFLIENKKKRDFCCASCLVNFINLNIDKKHEVSIILSKYR